MGSPGFRSSLRSLKRAVARKISIKRNYSVFLVVHSIAPAELEALLHQHPAVREAGVVGAEHPTHGEVPVAFVALQPGATATGDELVSYVNSRATYRMRLAGGARFVDQLPRGGGAKLDRNALKSMLEN